MSEFIALDRCAAHSGRYWIRRDGSEIRAGTNFADAETLQPGFVSAMVRAGIA